jgi:hypothetical protein
MTIALTKREIDAIFKRRNKIRWEKYLDVYDYLLSHMHTAHTLADYERKFNYFYQVRRNAEWRAKFYSLFYGLRGREVKFADILSVLFRETQKIEASFASKLAATLDPELPIIDRHVLSYIGERLPSASKDSAERMAIISELYAAMKKGFSEFLATAPGSYILERFTEEYPTRTISDMKKLDFVLWQSGGKKVT